MKNENRSYSDGQARFEQLVSLAIKVSDASGGINTSNRGIEATKIFTRLTLSAMTINSLLPGNGVNATDLWDVPSVATLTRAFIETAHRHLYLSESGLSNDESEFRLRLFYFHMNSEKYRLFKEGNANQKLLTEFEQKLPVAKEQIRESSFFLGLAKERANLVKAGKVDMHLSDEEIASRFSLVSGRFKSTYRLLSNHAHGAPFATFSQSNTRGRGLRNEVEEDYMFLFVMLLGQYLAKVVIAQVDMLSIGVVNQQDAGLMSAALDTA